MNENDVELRWDVKEKPPKKRKKRKWLRRTIEVIIIFIISGAVSFAFFSYPYWKKVKKQAIELADQHVSYEITHPGWSFPGKIWSAPAPLYLPKDRRIAHAKARNYKQKCPAKNPGEYCAKDGKVVPRGGFFPDGQQPPGTKNWTRPLAMEPILLGMLVGPDGEIREHLPLKEAPKVLIDAISLGKLLVSKNKREAKLIRFCGPPNSSNKEAVVTF